MRPNYTLTVIACPISALLSALTTTVSDMMFTVADYVEISPLDPWHTAVLREAQKILTGDDESSAPPKQAPPAASTGGGGAPMPIAEFLGSSESGEKVEAVPAVPAADAGAQSSDDDGDLFS